MSDVRPELYRRRSNTAQKISSLQQYAAELAAQLRQLQLQNDSARKRERVLSAVCAATRLAVDVIQALRGTALAGIGPPVSSFQSLSIAKIDACIKITLRNQRSPSQGPTIVPPRPLQWPSDATAPLAPQLADGGPLALLQHCMGLLQQHPDHFGWVQRQTPETSRDMMYLMQGVIHQLYSMAQHANGSQECEHRQRRDTGVPGGDTSKSRRGRGSSSSSSSSSTPSQLGSTGCGSSAVPPALAAAAAGGVAAGAAVGGGRALGATLAFLEVAAVVHDALLDQQQQQQQQVVVAQQRKTAHSNSAGALVIAQQQLVEEWAAVLVAAAQHGCWAQPGVGVSSSARHAAAAGGDTPVEAGGMSDVDCALLGAVMGLMGALQVVYLNEPGWIMALGERSIRPVPAAQLQAVTQSMCLGSVQLKEALWVAALYQDLRKPHTYVQSGLEAQVVEVMGSMMQQGQPPPAGAAPQPAAAAAAAAGAAAGAGVASSGQPKPTSSGGGSESGDPQQLRQLCVQLHAQARLDMWWEVLQYSQVWGLLSLRQVAAFVICMAPAGPSPNCWSTRLLLALLEGQQSQLAATAAAAAGLSGAGASKAGATRQLGKAEGRSRSQAGCAGAGSSEPGMAQPWEPLPLVVVPPQLLQLDNRPNQTAEAAAAVAAAAAHDATTAAGGSASRPKLTRAGQAMAPVPVAAAHTSYQAASDSARAPCMAPPAVPTEPAELSGGSSALTAKQRDQQLHLAAPSQLTPAAVASSGDHAGGWMGWLGGPNGPLGCDAPQLMPLVVAAQMSAAAAAAAQAAPPAPAPAPATAPQTPAAEVPGQVLDMGACDAPHSPVPPDLFERENCVSSGPDVPLLDQACPSLAHPGGGAGDGATPPPFDLLSVRPNLALPDNALDLLQQLLADLGDLPLQLPADLL